jgi:hypothetical protein
MPATRITDVLVLRILKRGRAMTAAAIAKSGTLPRATVRQGLVYLRAEKRVYVSGFAEATGQGRERPIYSIGSLPDVTFVPKEPKQSKAEYVERNRMKIRMRDRARRRGWNKPLNGRAP